MAQSQQLARIILQGNFLDRLETAEREIRRLKEVAIRVENDGTLLLPGVLLKVLTEAPEAAPAGFVRLYVENDSGTVYLRAVDEEGAVEDVANW